MTTKTIHGGNHDRDTKVLVAPCVSKGPATKSLLTRSVLFTVHGALAYPTPLAYWVWLYYVHKANDTGKVDSA